MASRVLIVEDEPDIRDLLAFHLEREGFKVSKCRSGAEALRQVRASPPDLVLLDLISRAGRARKTRRWSARVYLARER